MATARPYVRDIRTFIEDSRVKVAMDEGFESTTFNWRATGTGAGFTAARWTTRSMAGDACMQMQTRAAGAAINDVVQARRHMSIPENTSTFVLSGFIATRDDILTLNHTVTLSPYFPELGTYTMWGLRWNGATPGWEYRGAAAWTAIPDLSRIYYSASDDWWVYWEIVGSLANLSYISLRVNALTVPLTVAASTNAGAGSSCELIATLTTLAAAQKTSWWDNVRLAFL